MATTEYDFNSTRNEIFQRAFRIVGALPLGQTLDGDQTAQAVQVLNDLIKSWQAKNVFLWTLQYLTFNTVVGTASYSLDDDPAVMWVDKAWITISSRDTELDSLSFRQYQDIPDKTNAGDPTFYCVTNAHTPTIYLWPTPNAVRAIKYLGITRLKDADSAAGTLDFPVRWTNAITYALAYELSNEYKLPLNERNFLKTQAETEFSIAKRSDRERTEEDYVEGAF